MGLLASLKNSYSSPVKTAGILSKLHEKLAGTRSSPACPGLPPPNLDVPKLRDLKSHSFPPPFNNNSAENQTINQTTENNDLDERRKRWILHSNNTSILTG